MAHTRAQGTDAFRHITDEISFEGKISVKDGADKVCVKGVVKRQRKLLLHLLSLRDCCLKRHKNTCSLKRHSNNTCCLKRHDRNKNTCSLKRPSDNTCQKIESYFDEQWSKPVWGGFYGDGEGIYDDPELPEPKGMPIVMTTYVDANLLHDYVTGRSCTGIIHLFNKTVMDWFSKLQNNVETATYGSEFTGLRTAVDQIHDLRYTAKSMGVPIVGSTYLFGDNLSSIISSTKSDGKIAKRWNILSFHRVREAVAHGIVKPFHINGKDNPADVLSKHTSSNVWYELMRPLIFWRIKHVRMDAGNRETEGSINLQSYNGNNGMSVSQVTQVTDVIEEMDENTNSTNDTHVNNGTDDAQVDVSTSTLTVRFI
mmetsp:Transcript_21451/g.24853  ORF Transcript_21451/g.24853 Transcript_21451/m.24853 type:complete len:369 (+) Transcript_21451:205-1311(+)